MMKFYLDFVTSGHGIREIDEPVNFDGTDFTIIQDDERLGRDRLLAGGSDVNLKFYRRLNHCFDIIMHNRAFYNHEAVIRFMVDFGTGITAVGQFSMQSMVTDTFDSLTVMIVQENVQANFKRHFETNVNLFSPTDIKGNPIAPVVPQLMLLKAKPIVQKSSWNWGQPQLVRTFVQRGADFAIIGPFPNLETFGIENSYAQFSNYYATQSPASNSELERIFDETTIIRAKNDLKNVKIKIKGVNLSVTSTGFGVYTRFSLNYGPTYTPGTSTSVVIFETDNNTFSISNQDFEVEIPLIPATHSAWLIISVASQSTIPSPTPVGTSLIGYSADKLEIEVTSEAYNTVVPLVRYIDAIKYAVKAACGLDVVAPRWEDGGEFYDQYITTAALMRNLYDKPFNISLKQIFEENIRPEVNGDFEIQDDNKIFIGLYPDFYRDYQIGLFKLKPVYENSKDEYSLISNEKYLCNTVNLSFKNYASQKESEQENTYDIVHGAGQWTIPNEQAENKRDIEIGFVRDAFLIEQTRRKAYDLSDTAATQDDDKIFIIDVIKDTSIKTFEATAMLQHIYNEDDSRLRLRNANVFSWILLGITTGSIFIIANGVNAGSYTVYEVTHNEIVLYNGPGDDNIAEQSTTFTYTLSSEVQLINRTNEGFSLIQNIADGDNFANLRFTKARILHNYYGQEMASNLLYANGDITNAMYKNNPKAVTQYAGEPEGITEGGAFRTEGAILSPDDRRLTLFCTFQHFWETQQLLRSQRGYITALDVKGLPIRLHPKKIVWLPEEKQRSLPGGLQGTIMLEAEERYQAYYYTIFGDGSGPIAVDLNIGAI